MELINLYFGNSRGNVPVKRDWREKFVIGMLESAGFDSHGVICDRRLRRFVDSSGLSEDVQLVRVGNFELMPYYWGDADEHPDVAGYDNFRDNGRGFSLQWYKYPLRDAYANREATDAEWREMWVDFVETVRAAVEDDG